MHSNPTCSRTTLFSDILSYAQQDEFCHWHRKVICQRLRHNSAKYLNNLSKMPVNLSENMSLQEYTDCKETDPVCSGYNTAHRFYAVINAKGFGNSLFEVILLVKIHDLVNIIDHSTDNCLACLVSGLSVYTVE
jgi:hypothetical protein